MARPSKQQESADRRIRNAFWHLLESHDYTDITVGMIVQEAQCNRGSFYYHYPNMEALIDCVIEEELFADFSVAQVIFSIASGFKLKDNYQTIISQRIGNLWLIAQRGGLDLIDPKIKTSVIGMWRTILCPNGEELNPNTLALLEYASSGIMGTMIGFCRKGYTPEEYFALLPEQTLRDVSRFTLSRISVYQNISEEEMIHRIQAVNHYLLESKK